MSHKLSMIDACNYVTSSYNRINYFLCKVTIEQLNKLYFFLQIG